MHFWHGRPAIPSLSSFPAFWGLAAAACLPCLPWQSPSHTCSMTAVVSLPTLHLTLRQHQLPNKKSYAPHAQTSAERVPLSPRCAAYVQVPYSGFAMMSRTVLCVAISRSIRTVVSVHTAAGMLLSGTWMASC